MELILVRHGISTANKDPIIHHTTPDHIIPLASEGFEQAKKAGYKIQKYLQDKYEASSFPKNLEECAEIPHRKIRLWVSPYLRTRQTADTMSSVMGWKDNCPIVTDRREDVALCEQQFGLFDGLTEEELKKKYPNEYEHYDKCERFEGRFWARMPLGESRFDVTLRVHQVFGTWQRDLERNNINTVIVVSHGVTLRAITMRWLHLPFEWFEKEPNPLNCSVRIIECGKDLGYL